MRLLLLAVSILLAILGHIKISTADLSEGRVFESHVDQGLFLLLMAGGFLALALVHVGRRARP